MTKEEFDDLVRRVRQGDNSALSYLQRLQDECIRRLMRNSSGSCDENQAYDIFVDSLLDFRKNVLHDKVVFDNIPAYMHRICWHKWLELNRKETREAKSAYQVETYHYATMHDPDHIAETESRHIEQLALIEQGLAQLSEQCRKVLYMSISDELSMAEIAASLGMASADVAKTTKSRCYKKLLEIVRKEQR